MKNTRTLTVSALLVAATALSACHPPHQKDSDVKVENASTFTVQAPAQATAQSAAATTTATDASTYGEEAGAYATAEATATVYQTVPVTVVNTVVVDSDEDNE